MSLVKLLRWPGRCRCRCRCRTVGTWILMITIMLFLRYMWLNMVTNIHDSSLEKHATPSASHTSTAEYEYSAPFSNGVLGKTFRVAPSILSRMGFPLPQSRMIFLTEAEAVDFVVVTAASGSPLFFTGLYALLLSARQHLPEQHIIVYDLGMNYNQLAKLRSACHVEVRAFNFKQYPDHVSDLHTYAWKPLIIHEVLSEYTGALWLDSSARVLTSEWRSELSQAVSKGHGALLLSYTGHSNYAATHPGMYHYIPSKMDELKRTQQWEANSMLLCRTQHVYNNVIKWWVLCALDKDCIAPTLNRRCDFNNVLLHHGKTRGRDTESTFAGCHRFDQSALNVLLANLFDFDAWAYYGKQTSQRVVTISRAADTFDKLEKLDTC